MAIIHLNPDGTPYLIDPALVGQVHSHHHTRESYIVQTASIDTMEELAEEATINHPKDTSMEDALFSDESLINHNIPCRLPPIRETNTMFTPFIQAPHPNEPVPLKVSPSLMCLRQSNLAMLAAA
jgi:hypothetical protein